MVKPKLNPDGIFVTQSGPAGVLSSTEVFTAINKTLQSAFPTVVPYAQHIPSYNDVWVSLFTIVLYLASPHAKFVAKWLTVLCHIHAALYSLSFANRITYLIFEILCLSQIVVTLEMILRSSHLWHVEYVGKDYTPNICLCCSHSWHLSHRVDSSILVLCVGVQHGSARCNCKVAISSSRT